MGPDSVREFRDVGGSIGRTSGNDWVLPDPERFISGTHAMIEWRDGGYFLVDTSTNGVFLNGAEQPIGHGSSMRLKHGDRFVIGGYQFLATVEQAAEPYLDYDPDPSSDRLGLGGSPPPATDPLAGLPPASPIDSEPPTSPERSDPFDGRATLDPLQAMGRLDDELSGSGADLLGSPSGQRGHGGTYGDRAATMDEHFQSPSATPEPPPDVPIPQNFNLGSPPESPNQIPDDEEWDKSVISRVARNRPKPEPHHSAPNTASPPNSVPPAAPPTRAAAPPQTPPPGAAVPPPAATPHSATPGGNDLIGLTRLLETAGLDPQAARSVASEELAEVFGQILQIQVRGMMDVLKARAEIKSEFRVPLTQIRPVENNPLKFSVDVQDALFSLFVREGTGFLSPVDAFTDGFEDIKAHQLAMMAGMRAAFDNLMRSMEPDNLKANFDQNLRRNAVFRKFNKMQYWDMYCEMYDGIAQNADEDFQRLFGDVFASAYEDQMQRLTSMRRR
jgi:type VI secretion system protein